RRDPSPPCPPTKDRFRMARTPPAEKLARIGNRNLRSSSRLLASRPGRPQSLAHLPRTRRATPPLRQTTRLHPHRTAPHHGAPFRWLLGLPNAWLLRRHSPLRLPR